MWRRSRFQEKGDSDQSISDEEVFNYDYGGNSVSLGDVVVKEKEEGLQLQSRLELLKGKCDNNRSHNQEHSSLFLEEDVEVPDSPDEGGCFSSRKICIRDSSEELISDGEENVMPSEFSVASGAKRFDHRSGIGEQDRENSWSMATKEAEALIHLDKNVSSFSSSSTCSKAGKSCKGAKSKMRPKFSFRFQSRKGISLPAISNSENDMSTKAGEVPERLEANDHRIIDHLIPEVLEDFHGIEEDQLEIVPIDVEPLGHGVIEHSMAELLDDLHDNASLLRGNSKMFDHIFHSMAELEEKGCQLLCGEVYVLLVIEL